MKESFSALMLTFLLIGLSVLTISIQLAEAESSHDVAVTDIRLYKTIMAKGYPMDINVTVANQGAFTETFNVTLSANATEIETQTVHDLPNGTSTVLTFKWGAGEWAFGNYTISSYAEPVLDETDTTDNTLVDGWVFATLAGDVDGDRDVDIFDIVEIASWYGQYVAQVWPPPPPPPEHDIDNDGFIGIFDIVIATRNYGESW